MPRKPDRLADFVALFGAKAWARRIDSLRGACTPTHAGRAFACRHALALTLDRLRHQPPRNAAETRLEALAQTIAETAATLSPAGRARLETLCAEAIAGPGTLVPVFHLFRTAELQRDRGFAVTLSGLEHATPYDLHLERDGSSAEIVCDTISAEAGRDVHRTAWSLLLDRVDPDLQAWLATHPGRYLLKMTLPQGLKRDGDAALAALHGRITNLLTTQRRADHDEAAVLRLDPLILAGSQAQDLGLMPSLRREFGHEAHLAVTQAGRAVLVMAARAAREDEVAEAVQRRMAEIAPTRLTGTRPGILAMFIEDTDRIEWQTLRDQLRLEGAARQFLTRPEARAVVAVTCASRLELFGAPGCADEPELRFRNPSHPQARDAALAPAVTSAP